MRGLLLVYINKCYFYFIIFLITNMDQRVDIYKAALSHQTGAGFDFFVYQGRFQFEQGFNFPVFQGRAQHGQGIGDIIRGAWRFFRKTIFKRTAAALKAGGEALKDGSKVKEIITNTLKPTVGTVMATTSEQFANHFLADKPTAAPGPAPIIGPPPGTLLEPLPLQSGSGKRKSVYKAHSRPAKRIAHSVQPYSHLPFRYNF